MNDRSAKTIDAGGSGAWFLLFGGADQEAPGGLRSLRGVFDTEEDARAAFRRLRLEHRSAPGWGELVVLERPDRVRALCWFGEPSKAMATHPAGSARVTGAPGTTTDVPGVSGRRRLRRRLGKVAAAVGGPGVRAGASR